MPCATDIAFSYLVARLIFGPGHPAIAFLLLLAIADDAAGLAILAIVYPQAPLQPAWLLLTVTAIGRGLAVAPPAIAQFLVVPADPRHAVVAVVLLDRGIHAALGLVPIIPCLPHAHSDLGIYAREELNRERHTQRV